MKRNARGALVLAWMATAGFPASPQAQVASPTSAKPLPSLQEKTDAELLQIVTGGKALAEPKKEVYDEDRVTLSPLDPLWEMQPQDAALAFAAAHLGKELTGVTLKIAQPDAQPPKSGEIGLRWISGNRYAPRAEGVTILKFDGSRSELLLSEVEIAGQASKAEIEAAVMKTDSHPLRPLVAQQTFEILWWLRHVRFGQAPEASSSATYTSGDDFGRFWMKPDGPASEDAIIGEPCGHCIARDGIETYESFAATLLQRLQDRSGIKRRFPIPKVGQHIDRDSDARFLHTRRPSADDSEAAKQWVSRLLEILRNPKRQYLHAEVVEILVPSSDPLRYSDDRIDTALLELVHRGLEAAAQLKTVDAQAKQIYELDSSKFPDAASFEKALDERENKVRAERRRLEEVQSTGLTAVEKLGFHGAVAAFPHLLRRARSENPDLYRGLNRPLIAAASIAARHPEVRPALIEFVGGRLAAADDSGSHEVLEAVWRADLREFRPQLERLAAIPPPADPGAFGTAAHRAAVIVTTWREPHALTRTKLHGMLSGYIGGGNSIPDILRAEFDALTPEEQLAFREFVMWMRTVEVRWSRRLLEDIFTPHTPRPDVLLEH